MFDNDTRIKIFSSSSHEEIEEQFNTWMRTSGTWEIEDIQIFNTKWGHHIYVFYNVG